MSNLTKIFIVLQLVGAIGLAVAVVLILGGQNPLKNQINAEREARVAQTAQVASLNTALAAARTAQATAHQELVDKISQLTKTNESLSSKLQVAEAHGQTVEAQYAEATATGVRLGATVEAMRKQIEAKDGELGGVRPQLVDLTRRNAELERSNNDLTSEKDANLNAINKLKEELATVRQSMQKTAAAGEAGAQLNAAPVAPVQINGRVEGLNDVNGRTYLTLSLGTRDGVQNGMRFTIYRKDAFIADAVVERAVPDQSVAMVTTPRQPVQKGDLAISGGGL